MVLYPCEDPRMVRYTPPQSDDSEELFIVIDNVGIP